MDTMDFCEKLIGRCENCGCREISIIKAEEKGKPGFSNGLWGSLVSIDDEHKHDKGLHIIYKCTKCKHKGRKVFDMGFVQTAFEAYSKGNHLSIDLEM